MKVNEKTTSLHTDRHREYQAMPLVELAKLIVQGSDRAALRELHDHRPLFRLHGGQPLLLAEFVNMLCSSPWATRFSSKNAVVLDHAHDLTIDKYSMLPVADALKSSRPCRGPDCRKYFRAFLEIWSRQGHSSGATGLLAEMASAQLLQSRVLRSFRLSCLEARRWIDPTRTRYAWKVNGFVIYVWMPTSMPGRQRRVWLEGNVEPPTASSPDERHRIQAMIDERLGIKTHFALDECIDGSDEHLQAQQMEDLVEQEISSHGLVDVVAEEKAYNIKKQRPAIQALGRTGLKRLIRQVMDDLRDGQYEERAIAASFGLSTPTLSRFAGLRWRNSEQGTPPDLWRNVARTIAGHKAFVDVAKEAGVWPLVHSVLKQNDSLEGEGVNS